MKKPFVAFFLSFFLPGAGLVYIGRWKWALINLAVVVLVGVLAELILTEEAFGGYMRYIAFCCAGGSGGLAQHLAVQMNQKVVRKDGA